MTVTITIQVDGESVAVGPAATQNVVAAPATPDLSEIWAALRSAHQDQLGLRTGDVVGRAYCEGRTAGLVDALVNLTGMTAMEVFSAVVDPEMVVEPEPQPAADLSSPPPPPKEGLLEHHRRLAAEAAEREEAGEETDMR